MAVIRSYVDGFKVTDLTEELLVVPNQYGLINELSIFSSEGVAQHTITFEQTNKTLGLIGDKIRGERANVSKDGTRLIRSYHIPHFPLDDALNVRDVKGVRAYSSDQQDPKDEAMARKLETIRKSHAVTLEFARMQAITQGTIYAPNGTVVGNYYNDFGVAQKVVSFNLASPTTDVLGKQREVIDHIQENIGSGEVPNGIIALCSPEFFDAYVSQAGVKTAYQFYQSSQEPYRKGLRSGRYSVFVHGDVTLYRYVGGYTDSNGNFNKFIPEGEAYYLPVGTQGTFKTYFSPADKWDLVNTVGEEAYVFTYEDPKGTATYIESEHNAIHLVTRPQVVVKATLA